MDQGQSNIPRWFLDIITFYDPGSSCSLVTTSLADVLNLLGQPITISSHTVNDARQLPTKYYELYIQTRSGTDELVMAFGVDKISTDFVAINILGILHLRFNSSDMS